MATITCTPCPTSSSGDGPIITECNKYVRVADVLGNDSVLKSLNNSLVFSGKGGTPICLADGSSSKRIRLDNLQGVAGKALTNLIGQDASGYWWKAFPDEALGAQILVGEAGAVSWQPKNAGSHCFPDEDILETDDPEPTIAAFDACGPNGQSCLVRLPVGYVESLIPTAENFDADQHAEDICAGATSSDDLTAAEVAAKKNLSIVCTPDGEKIVIDEPAAASGGSMAMGLASDNTFVLGDSYSQLATWAVYEGAGLVTTAGGIITFASAGQYLFNFACRPFATLSGPEVDVQVFVNGVENSGNPAGAFVLSASASPMITYPFAGTFAVGNTIEWKGKKTPSRGASITNSKLTILKVS